MIEKKRVLYLATITCPFCSAKSEEEMRDNACQFFWECPACKRLVKPKKGIVVFFVRTLRHRVHLFKKTNRVVNGNRYKSD